MVLNGVYRGIVTDNADPEGLKRLKAQVPQLLNDVETGWAWPVLRSTADPVLSVGAPVWLSFENGEIERPVWLGTWVTY